MDVRMTGGAVIRRHPPLVEPEVQVARRARGLFVCPFQFESSRPGVIEDRIRPQRSPRVGPVTVRAGETVQQVSVRALRRGLTGGTLKAHRRQK